MKIKFVSDPRKEVMDHNLNAAVDNLAKQTQNFELVLGASEAFASDKAPSFIAKDTFFIAGETAYIAMRNIARGEPLVERVNVRPTTLTEYIAAQAKEKEQ